ncbi:asparaginase [Thalassobaculum sp.]|uniref:asparaginase n=1 Tax=Thalassobaculum sp. TaxID=2022740 RepID=UPI003B5A5689
MNDVTPIALPDDRILRVHVDQPAAPIVIEVTRGSMVESVHRVIAAVTDASGKAVMAWGDIDRLVYGRSAIKPIQALPVLESGAADAFHLGEDEVTLCCASHSGEAMHVDRVNAWLGRLGLSAEDLECGPQIPTHEASAHAMLRAGEAPTRAHNNCSGKHSGMLTTAVHLGEPTKGYIRDEHPVQKRLRAVMQEMCGCDLSGVPTGYDGCGIPVFGVPLKGMATAMAQFADPSRLSPTRAAATRRIVAACAKHPLLIGGTGRFNSAVLAETGEACLLKSGAEGVFAGAVPGRGYGICLKTDDGNGRAASTAMAAILRHLGVIDDALAKRLADRLVQPVHNWEGRLVGHVRPAPDLAF